MAKEIKAKTFFIMRSRPSKAYASRQAVSTKGAVSSGFQVVSQSEFSALGIEEFGVGGGQPAEDGLYERGINGRRMEELDRCRIAGTERLKGKLAGAEDFVYALCTDL